MVLFLGSQTDIPQTYVKNRLTLARLLIRFPRHFQTSQTWLRSSVCSQSHGLCMVVRLGNDHCSNFLVNPLETSLNDTQPGYLQSPCIFVGQGTRRLHSQSPPRAGVSFAVPRTQAGTGRRTCHSDCWIWGYCSVGPEARRWGGAVHY